MACKIFIVSQIQDIGELMADMESATALRKKEHADFLEAEDEMDKAIIALKVISLFEFERARNVQIARPI